MNIPQQYNRLMPYLIVADTTAFIKFIKAVFGATFQMIVPRNEGVIMHGELRIGEAVIMFADTTPEFSTRPAGMFIFVESVEDTHKKAIATGAVSVMEPTKQEYGLTCGFKVPFGNDLWPTEAD